MTVRFKEAVCILLADAAGDVSPQTLQPLYCLGVGIDQRRLFLRTVGRYAARASREASVTGTLLQRADVFLAPC